MIQIGLSRADTWLSKSIRWFGKRKTGDARYSHAFIKVDDDIVESWSTGLRIRPYSAYSNIDHILYTPTFLSVSEARKIRLEALIQVGTYKGIYGFFKLPLFALDAIFKTYWFTKNVGVRSFKVCSQWSTYLFYKYAHYPHFCNWRSMSPDDIDDFCKDNPESWIPKVIES